MLDHAGKRSRLQGTHSVTHALESSPGKHTLAERAYSSTVQQQVTEGASHDAAVRSPAAHGASAAFAPPHGDWVQRTFGRPDLRAPGDLATRFTASSTAPARSAAVLQRRASGPSNEHVHAAAARGIESPATSLPFADRIQASFGPRHDVASIQAHVGGAATGAAAAMGASGYAAGNHVVFAGAPDLHTAAHEAAHVVQQRGGVQLSGGVGQAGDAYEHHADAVADLVVQGKSAADLLAQRAPGAPDRGREDQTRHACSTCGGAISGAGECTTCKAGEAAAPQPAAVPAVQRQPDGPSPSANQGNGPASQPADKSGDGPSTGADPGADPAQGPIATGPVSTWGWGGDATRSVYAPCNIVEMDRASFLAFEATALSRGARRAAAAQAKGGFGITTSTVTDAKPPPIEAEPIQDGGKTKFRLKPTRAEMAPIQSAVTSPGEFVEGIFHWVTQGGTVCRSGDYPIRWVLTADGAVKVKQGEQEHCNDFRAAFANTLALYASSINNVASANRIYSTEKQAIGDALSYLQMSQPDEMMANYIAAASRTARRDNTAHVPRPRTPQEPDPGCREIRLVLNAAAWPGIPGIASDALVNPPPRP
ncbi:MAG: DUF4157 domain-containing protein [Deltaproteobacteria bacterium]|nr:MAG: DUF4157 domain-containing protein [Deltaproteobacteria bacterium]